MTSRPTKPVLFLDILTGDPVQRRRLERMMYGTGTYAERMRKACRISQREFRWIDASRMRFPDPQGFRAIIIGGSVVDPTRRREDPWIEAAFRFIRRAFRAGTPILGVCGGLQFTARALGGTVVHNPRGRDFGTARISLSPQGARDYLFKGLPSTLAVQESHKCIVPTLRPGWVRLARSRKTPLEAIAIGEKVRLVQFHPEMTVGDLRKLGRSRKPMLIAEGFIEPERFPELLKQLQDTKRNGTRMLTNFLQHHR